MSHKVTRAGAISEEKDKRMDSPIKDMKKKIAANVEKEKMADKPADKRERATDKKEKRSQKEERQRENGETRSNGDASADKGADNKAAKSNGDAPKADTTQAEAKPQSKSKLNGAANGSPVSDRPEQPYPDDPEDPDEMFPELKYDESDAESPPPRQQSQGTKILKMTEVPSSSLDAAAAVTATPVTATPVTATPVTETPVTAPAVTTTAVTDAADVSADKLEPVVVLEDCDAAELESRKPDTNYAKSRVKVSPYRRSPRLLDVTASSTRANYSGNNTTMEADLSASLSESGVGSLRSVRGRRSYRLLPALSITRPAPAAAATVAQADRPTGTVIGRKRKPSPAAAAAPPVTPGGAAPGGGGGGGGAALGGEGGEKRRRLGGVWEPLRRVLSSTPLPARRAAPIVGINSDLPMSAPVAAGPVAVAPVAAGDGLKDAPAADAKRCAIM